MFVQTISFYTKLNMPRIFFILYYIYIKFNYMSECTFKVDTYF